ncbi:MAG: hypothetical protein IKQ07_01730 [Bacteroidaceae bacterium]|nr:hypothetical protein [Bacteroidaceae bacterium]
MIFNATARNKISHSKESPTPQQGKPNATARNFRRYSKELPTPLLECPHAA